MILDPFWTRSEAAQVQFLQALRKDPLVLRWGSLRPSVMRHLERAVRLDPSYHAAHYCLALCYCFWRRMDEALTEARRAVALEPHFPEGHLVLGGIYEMRGHLQEAIREYRKALAIQPSALAHYHLGHAWRLLGDRKAALREYQRALWLGDLPIVRLEIALVLSQQGKFRRALAGFRRVLREPLRPPEADPSFFDLPEEERLVKMRDFLEQEMVIGDALRWCRSLSRSDDPEVLQLMGYLHWLRGEWESAADCLERVRQARGPTFELNYELGVAYFSLGNYLRALRFLRRSDRYGAHLRLALYWRYVRHDYPRAVEELRRALRRRPNAPEALKQLKEVLKLLGHETAGLDLGSGRNAA